MGKPIVDRPDEFPEFIYRGEREATPMQTYVLGCQEAAAGVSHEDHVGCVTLPHEGPSLLGGPFTSSPLDRAAQALENLDSSDFHERQTKDYTEMARAVLMAVREPSELQAHTVSRILEKRGEYSYQSPVWVWKTMIDAALNQ